MGPKSNDSRRLVRPRDGTGTICGRRRQAPCNIANYVPKLALFPDGCRQCPVGAYKVASADCAHVRSKSAAAPLGRKNRDDDRRRTFPSNAHDSQDHRPIPFNGQGSRRSKHRRVPQPGGYAAQHPPSCPNGSMANSKRRGAIWGLARSNAPNHCRHRSCDAKHRIEILSISRALPFGLCFSA